MHIAILQENFFLQKVVGHVVGSIFFSFEYFFILIFEKKNVSSTSLSLNGSILVIPRNKYELFICKCKNEVFELF